MYMYQILHKARSSEVCTKKQDKDRKAFNYKFTAKGYFDRENSYCIKEK